MIQWLRDITSKHGIGEDALRELTEFLEGALPRTRTRRLDAAGASSGIASAPSTLENLDCRYEDVGRIGVGGFSEVREVWDHHIGRYVARKVQLPSMSSPEDCTRFRQEVRITAQLQHPGIVPLYDWGELADGRIWFTMKRVRGDTIEKRIMALHCLEGNEFVRHIRRLLDDFRRLCEPVAHAHEKGIIHRDITPQNLMVGELGEVHVMDWGLARVLDFSACEAARSSAGRQLGREARAEAAALDSGEGSPAVDPSESSVRTRVAGTPFYMSPEQARGDIAAMSPASDVYSLGAVLYEILSGAPPYFRSDGEQEPPDGLFARVRDEPPRSIDETARCEVPRALVPLCRKAMERDPALRYAHAGALMEAVRDWLDGADRQERAARIVDEANRQHLPSIANMRRTAEQWMAQSRLLLDRLSSFDRAQDKAEGWKLEDDAGALEQEALREEINWTQKLRSALNEVPDLEEAHAALAEHYAARLLRAEADHDQLAATSFAALLGDHAAKLRADTRESYEALLRGLGRLTVVTEPPSARVVIKPYTSINRYLMIDEARAITVSAPIRELSLPRGSYLLQISAPGRCEMRYPVAIGRDEHWDGIRPGSAAPSPVYLPREDELGSGDVYVPAGWFIAGGDPRAGESLPRRRVWLDGFVIQKHPITNDDYIDFLNALIAEGRNEEALQYCPRQGPGGTMDDVAQLAYLFDERSRRYALKDPLRERSLPVVFVDWHAAMAYAAYWARRTMLPWRLPSEIEWEKAARGVDGRFMPWGDHVEPTWACVSGSHPDRKGVMRVDDFPTDVSPYGVRGMAGNVRDWCVERWSLDGPRVVSDVMQVDVAPADDDAYRPMRGGAWISVGDLGRLAVRYSEQPTKRHGVLGFRLARPLSR